MERVKVTRDIVILLLISGFVILWNLGTGSLTSWDEGIYAQVAREILNSNNWIDLSLAGKEWSDKPPLYMWITVLFYKVFGVNEFSARFFSALCGMGTVIVTYLFANKLYSRRIAFISALILLTTRHFIWSAKTGMLDSTFTFFITLSLFLFKIGLEKKKYLFFSLIAFTGAFLTKGVGAFLIPFVLFFYLIFTKNIKIIKEPALLLGILVSVIILGWWHWLAISHYGRGFVAGYFIKHLFLRTTAAIEGHTGTIYTYFKVLPNKGRPWGVFGLIILAAATWRIFKKREKEHIFAVVWAAVIFLFFSLVKTKLHWYIIPIYPVFSMLTGWAISRVFGKFAITIAFLLTFISLVYLSTGKKSIFNLDYIPETKKIASDIKKMLPKDEKISLYAIGDPGALFYFADIGEHVEFSKLQGLLKKKNKYILFDKENFKNSPQASFSIIEQTSNFIAVKTKEQYR